MKVTGFKFEIIHSRPVNVRVQTDYYAKPIMLHALCPSGINGSKWQCWSQQELAIYEQIGSMLVSQ